MVSDMDKLRAMFSMRVESVDAVREAARRKPKREPKPRRPLKYEYKSGGNVVRERLVDPSACAPGSFRTITNRNSKGRLPEGLHVLSCCPRSAARDATDNACIDRAGDRVGGITQAIIHHVERFAIRHPREWKQIGRERPDANGIVTVLPAYVPGHEKGGSSMGKGSFGDIGNMFGDVEFESREDLVNWMTEGGYVEKALQERRESKRAKREKYKARREAQEGSGGSMEGTGSASDSDPGSMDFEDNVAIRAWMAMNAPAGYVGETASSGEAGAEEY